MRALIISRADSPGSGHNISLCIPSQSFLLTTLLQIYLIISTLFQIYLHVISTLSCLYIWTAMLPDCLSLGVLVTPGTRTSDHCITAYSDTAAGSSPELAICHRSVTSCGPDYYWKRQRPSDPQIIYCRMTSAIQITMQYCVRVAIQWGLTKQIITNANNDQKVHGNIINLWCELNFKTFYILLFRCVSHIMSSPRNDHKFLSIIS